MCVCVCVCLCRLEPYGEAMAIIEFARAEANRKARGLQHPQLCLDAIQAGVADGGMAGLKKVSARTCTHTHTHRHTRAHRRTPGIRPQHAQIWQTPSASKLINQSMCVCVYVCARVCVAQEGECFAKAASLDTHKALVHIFFAQRATKKVRGVTDAGT